MDKYLDEEIIHKSKSKEIKINTKYATKESFLDKGFNNINNNNKKDDHKINRYKRNSSQVNENKNNNQEEVCCSEACIIF